MKIHFIDYAFILEIISVLDTSNPETLLINPLKETSA